MAERLSEWQCLIDFGIVEEIAMGVWDTLYGMYERDEYAGTPESLALLDKVLQQNPGDVTWIDVDEGKTYLHIAAGMYLHGSIPVLIRHGFDPNARSFSGETPLHSIFGEREEYENTVLTAYRLLDGGSDPNVVKHQG
ncbi:MAG: hypothetical protein LC104_00480, partial [Bacteroidales bacterium]|nr:hypothetical protein [Bacteroidales bacterium]